MLPLRQIVCNESPRLVIARDFKVDLPIRGGWGYTQFDACIIDKSDSSVDPLSPFNGVAIEHFFVEKRIYEEMIIFRPEGQKFSGIKWEITEQDLIHNDARTFDKLTCEITAFHDKDWNELKSEFEGPHGITSPSFDLAAHESKRDKRMIRFVREFWFEVSSLFKVH